jgi:gliding motility-associated-like protein
LSINASTGVINLAGSTPGTYTVTYSVAASGCNPAGNSTASITINASFAPVLTFSYTSPVCSNGTNPVPVTVPGFTTGGTFSAPGGLSINASTGVINLAGSTPGTYTITYTVAASGCNPGGSSTSPITITAAIVPVTAFSYTSPVCVNGTNPAPATTPGFTTGGTFSAPAGLSVNASTGVINLAGSTPGTYTVTYTVAASGCNPARSSTANITITPSVIPVTGFSYTTPVCANDPNPAPQVNSGFTVGGTFSSTPGLSVNASTGLINLAASTPGTYTITYSVSATGCNPARSSTASITINPSIIPVTGFSYTSPVCANAANPSPVPVTGFVTGGVFSSTAGLSLNAATGVVNLAASTPGTYTITYSVTAAGCSLAGSSTATLQINALPPAPGVTSPVRYCLNASTIPLTASGSNLVWYTTATGGTGSLTPPKPSSSIVGTFPFYVAQRINGCEGPRALIEVVVHPLPTVDAGPAKQVLIGRSVQLDGVATGNNVTIIWTSQPPSVIQNPTSATPVVSPLVNTLYTMTVTSGNGCVALDTVSVKVLQEIVIPNVFSPNGDGINDKWIIKNIEQYTNNVVQIYNRYGQLLVETKGYSSSNAWDGTNKGNPLPVGAYYYIIRLNDGRGPFSGTISILR